MESHPDESRRFEFGSNWRQFLRVLTPERIARAQSSLAEMLHADSLAGMRFLDAGCGSGLFSLAARRMGAEVVSFDFDPVSVGCAEQLKRAHARDDPLWHIERGSVLDASFMSALGSFDIVYSWGVLHHTGAMWNALDSACRAVNANGRLFIALYNDQGRKSIWWRRVKRAYNTMPEIFRPAYLLAFAAAIETGALAVSLARLQPSRFIDRWKRYDNVRGMSRWHDVVDWVGGYPFEVATPDGVVNFCRARGFSVLRLNSCGQKMGCNEFVFRRGGPRLA